VFGEFLAMAEAKDHRLDLVVVGERPPEDAVRRRLGFLGGVEEVRGGGGHG
jgi:hypothetical protein